MRFYFSCGVNFNMFELKLSKNKKDLDVLLCESAQHPLISEVRNIKSILEPCSNVSELEAQDIETLAILYLDLQSLLLIHDSTEQQKFLSDISERTMRFKMIEDLITLSLQKLKLDEKITKVRGQRVSISEMRKAFSLWSNESLQLTKKNLEANLQYHADRFAYGSFFNKSQTELQKENILPRFWG
jgi:hypothetical protein